MLTLLEYSGGVRFLRLFDSARSWNVRDVFGSAIRSDDGQIFMRIKVPSETTLDGNVLRTTARCIVSVTMPHIDDVLMEAAESLFAHAEQARFPGLRDTGGT
ncbi:hypothetical protein [Paraburkholderia lacunae]|uniref:Uncharacterized protein n=1 Tax=Paraburkholderia lacunae TaxID=2211104 RepID=A0A370N902_9BURK|nr:hypothetical protein [Paraburkholderia lacunae]RDK02084.1 hypothetical protein DLM46_14155 [Paraburkholderia lacunae]